jgi:hypothetical protein
MFRLKDSIIAQRSSFALPTELLSTCPTQL